MIRKNTFALTEKRVALDLIRREVVTGPTVFDRHITERGFGNALECGDTRALTAIDHARVVIESVLRNVCPGCRLVDAKKTEDCMDKRQRREIMGEYFNGTNGDIVVNAERFLKENQDIEVMSITQSGGDNVTRIVVWYTVKP